MVNSLKTATSRLVRKGSKHDDNDLLMNPYLKKTTKDQQNKSFFKMFEKYLLENPNTKIKIKDINSENDKNNREYKKKRSYRN